MMTARDWKEYVRKRLALPKVSAAREAELIEDVAQQMEEAYREALRQGANEREARAAAERHIRDWQKFAREVAQGERRNGQPLGTRAEDLFSGAGSKRGGAGMILADFLSDAVHGLRALRKNPSFALAAVGVLALGIGANVTMYSVAETVVFRALPFPQPSRLLAIWNEYEGKPSHNSPPDYQDRVVMSQSLESIAAFDERQADLTGRGEPVRLGVARTTASFFTVLGVAPFVGRAYSAEEDKPGQGNVIVLSYESWQSRFGGDRNILGASLTLNGVPRTVIGVMPREFRLHTRDVEAWVPLAFRPDQLADSFRGNEYLTVIARMRHGATLQQVETEMDGIAASVLTRVPRRRDFLSRVRWAARVVPLHEQLVGEIRPAVLTVLGAVALVLLMACVNVANLMLARAMARRKEISTRIALGASPGRLARLLFTESLVLAVVGGAVGLAIAAAAIRVIAATPVAGVPRLGEIAIHASTVGYTAGIVLLTAMLFGIAPIRLLLRGDLASSLKERSESAARGPRMWTNHLLVTAQLAMALLVLVGAGLLVRTFQNLTRTSPGFSTENRITFRVAMPATRYPDAAQRALFVQQLGERLRALPGVRHAGFSHALPLVGVNDTSTIRIEGVDVPPGTPLPSAETRSVDPGYLEAMGIPLHEGRNFEARDQAATTQVALVDRRLAEKHWPGQSAIGKRLGFGGDSWWEVIGVVGSVKNRGLDADGLGQFYWVHAQDPEPTVYGVLAVASEGGNWRATIASTVLSLDAAMPIDDVRTLEQRVAASIAPRKHVSTLLMIFGGVGLLLAASGLYGLISYLVGQRTHEFAIRMAMGAQQSDVMRLVLRQGAQLAAGGLALGIFAGLALSRAIESQLFGVAPTDWAVFSVAVTILAVVALAATVVPARRATRVDPLTALRSE